MKIVLACLMCFVLGASESFAIDGGPSYGGGSGAVVTGTYAGVMVPMPTELSPGPPPITLTDNSLVLFSMKIPKEGLAAGDAVVFRNGFFYSGTIQGSADPDSAKLTGIVNTSFDEDVTTGGTAGTVTAHFEGNGQFVNAKIVSNNNTASTASARIRGKASLTFVLGVNSEVVPNSALGDSGGPIFYKVKGFKQSENS